MELRTPRDRDGSFEPQLVKKNKTCIIGMNNQILALYARGMTTREITSVFKEMYDADVSPALISKITDAVIDQVVEWQNRPLDAIYPIVYLDCIVLKVRQDSRVISKAVFLALGINLDGQKELPGMWLAENEGAKFWLNVLTELKNRGLNDILIACVDGLKGFPEAINAVYPEASRKVIINNRQYGAPLTLTSVMVLSDCYSWANEQFGHASLGDPRRTRRLVSLASSLAQHAGLSIVKSSQSTAQVEGAYRLMRNPSVSPEAIAEAGFTATARACEAHPLLLALEDTTTISFSHSTAFDDLGNTTTNPKTRGLLAHSVLMYAPDSALPVGLIEQQRWSRATDTYGVKHQRKERPCEEKESSRWQQASERMAERLGEIQKRVITVCGLEADIWHYLHYKVSHGQRFVVRAAQNSRQEEAPGKLFELPEVLTTA